ncbi:MAG: glycosyltransferase 61 family protein [Paracoccus sp. (in: a-proteobacteria)]|nr:glycosyltransferase 61 family protein [Paracoccus sp. (in: a-proteobacteria)]
MNEPAATPPQPAGGWSESVTEIAGAIIVPPDSPRKRQRAGVIDAQGNHVPQGATWRLGNALTLAPPPPGQVDEVLTGRWLWAGVLFDHFGHFLVESMSRLWAAHHDTAASRGLDGICYIPKRPRRRGALRGFQQQVLDVFGLSLPVRLVWRPSRVETLVVPGQGFGLGDMIGGTAAMRDAVHRHFAAGITPDGAERLYLSRSALAPEEGAILGETVIEDHLRAQGYRIMHPQMHSLSEQLAQMKAARQIIFADGSAGHLLAYVARPDQQIACLPRRSFWVDGPVDHIAGFTGRAPLVLDSIAQEWAAPGRRDFRGVTYALHDMPALSARLVAAGMLDQGTRWPALPEDMALNLIRAQGREGIFTDQMQP